MGKALGLKKNVFNGPVDIHWDQVGQGNKETILFIHGFSDSKETFYAIARPLPRKYNIIIPQLPGFGDTEKRQDLRYGLLDYVNWLQPFLSSLPVEKVHLVGHSLGGAISSYLAIKCPEKVSSLTLVGSSGFLLENYNTFYEEFLEGKSLFLINTPADYESFVHRVFHKEIKGAHSHFPGIIIIQLYGAYFRGNGVRLVLLALSTKACANSKTTDNANNASLTPSVMKHQAGKMGMRPIKVPWPVKKFMMKEKMDNHEWYKKISTDMSHEMVSSEFGGDLKTLLKKVPFPVNIIWGKEDTLFPYQMAEDAHKNIPGSTLNLLEQVGQCPHLETPGLFVKTLGKVLSSK